MSNNSIDIDFSLAKHKLAVSDESFTFECYFFGTNQSLPEGMGKMKDFFFIWQGKMKDGNIPKWKNFTFEDFKNWHSNIRVIKCGELQDKPDEVLIAGENFIQFWGENPCLNKFVRV